MELPEHIETYNNLFDWVYEHQMKLADSTEEIQLCFSGETLSIYHWAKRLGIREGTFVERLARYRWACRYPEQLRYPREYLLHVGIRG